MHLDRSIYYNYKYYDFPVHDMLPEVYIPQNSLYGKSRNLFTLNKFKKQMKTKFEEIANKFDNDFENYYRHILHTLFLELQEMEGQVAYKYGEVQTEDLNKAKHLMAILWAISYRVDSPDLATLDSYTKLIKYLNRVDKKIKVAYTVEEILDALS